MAKNDRATKVSSLHLLCRGYLQHRVGTVFRSRPSMAIPLCGTTAAKSPADLRVPGNGRRVVRYHLPGGGADPGAWLVTGGSRSGWESTRPCRSCPTHLERSMAPRDRSPLPDERSHLVDSFRRVSARRGPFFKRDILEVGRGTTRPQDIGRNVLSHRSHGANL